MNMPRRAHSTLLLLAIAGTLIWSLPRAEGQQPPSKSGEPSTKPTNDPRTIVDALASHNPAPRIEENTIQLPVYAPKWDKQEERRVRESFRTAVEHADEIWPELLKHFDDERYSVTRESPSGPYHNWSVGQVCQLIVEDSLSRAYMDKQKGPGTKEAYFRMAYPPMVRGKAQLKAWCEQRSKQPLYELQIEMCRWAIAELTKPDAEPEAQREWTAAIVAEIDALSKSKKAIPPHALYAPD